MENAVKLFASDGASFPVAYSDDYCLPPFSNVKKSVNNFKSFSYREDDIWILAYPGSGTHWFWEITSMVVNGKAERMDTVKEEAMIEAMGEYSPDHFDKITSPRVLNTHLPPTYFPEEVLRSGTIIYLVRNPKAACVSFYNLIKGFTEDYDGSFTGYYELFRDGKTEYGDWIDHLSKWWAVAKRNKNFLFLTYEKAKMDLTLSVKKVAEFIQKPTSDKLVRDICELCTFKRMKQDKREFMNHCFRENSSYYRKGTVDDWKKWYTVAQNEEYDAMFAERTKLWDADLKNLVMLQ